MKLRIYSDIHLDMHDIDNLWYPPALPDDQDTVLIIAGDLWHGTKWIDYAGCSWISKVARRFKTVLIVLGNHDYWPCDQDITIKNGADKCSAMLQDFCLFNVHVLDMSTFVSGEFLFVGATLWTDMNKNDPLTMHNMPKFMSYDGDCAYETGPNGRWHKFTSERWVQTHEKHRDYIKHVVEQNKDKKIIVITHHLPLLTLSDPSFAVNMSNAYYMSDLSNLILDNEHIKLWCYGHMHYHNDVVVGETRLMNNCVGYKHQCFEDRGLVKHEVIELE